MAHNEPASLQIEKLRLGSIAGRIGFPAFVIGIAAVLAAFYLGLQNDEQKISHFFHAYLTAYTFFMAITLGALVFVMIHHITRAGWSVTVRRLAEGLSLNIFLMVILALPFFVLRVGPNHQMGVQYLLPWLNPALQHHEEISAKHGYLNPAFFGIRFAAYMLLFCFLAWNYASKSAKQDQTGDVKTSTLLERLAAPGIILFAFGMTAFIIDFVMSLNPFWFSTIFGVYYFAGCFLSAVASIILLALALQKRGRLGNAVNHEHYHDLGKWMFAFTFFWGYIAFSQYMLIWYANLPEETQFFIPRQIEIWGSISILLLVVHLLIPFPGLLSRHIKRKNALLAFWAVWSLLACALDIFWLVMPNFWINKLPTLIHNPNATITEALAEILDKHSIYHLKDESIRSIMEYPLTLNPVIITALCFIGIGGLYIFSTMLALKNKSLVPLRDPKLPESLAFHNI